MNCLVTGGLGFIGSHLVRRLRELGDSVRIIDNAWARDEQNADLGWRTGEAALRAEFQNPRASARPDWVFHLAAVSRTTHALAAPERCVRTNVLGSLQVLEAARCARENPRVVLASSNIVYGSPNPYKASKAAMEDLMSSYNACCGLNCIALRYSNTYGSGMRWEDPICLASLRRSAAEKGYVELTGDGEQSRDWTHVSDIVEGTIAAAQSNAKGVIDLTSEQHRSMNHMAAFFAVPVHYVPERLGDTDVISQRGRLAKEILGWEAKIRVEDGIKDVLKDCLEESKRAVGTRFCNEEFGANTVVQGVAL